MKPTARIICDECLSNKVVEYLEQMGYEVIRAEKGEIDSGIKALGYKLDAWILTANIGDFRNYPKALYVNSRARPEDVYRRLKNMGV